MKPNSRCNVRFSWRHHRGRMRNRHSCVWGMYRGIMDKLVARYLFALDSALPKG